MYMTVIIIIGMPNGDIEAVKYNEAVPDSVLSEIFLWRSEGATDMDVITRLRLRTVPSGFKPHPWSKGISLQLYKIFSNALYKEI